MAIEEHEHKYKPDAWKAYSFVELAQWVDLLTKRAAMRADDEKRKKDLTDAANYGEMFARKLAEVLGT